jgi:hypothetical protein
LRDGDYRDPERGLDEHPFVLLVGLTLSQALALKFLPQGANTIWIWIG